jgi:hypothetical protein
MFIIQPKYIQFRMRVQRRLLSQTDGLCRLVLSRMWSVIAIARTANLCAIEYSANVTALSIVSGKTLKLNIADQQGAAFETGSRSQSAAMRLPVDHTSIRTLSACVSAAAAKVS